MGLLQGATELFPVSSLGHSVIIPSLLHWAFKQSDPTFVPFLVLLHLGTAGALLVLYRQQWIAIVRGFFTAAVRGRITTEPERLAMLLLTGTIPAGILGVYFETRIKSLFASPYVAAGFLIVNGILLLGFETLRRRAERRAALFVPPCDAGDPCRGRRRSASALRERRGGWRISRGRGSIGRGCIHERAISPPLLPV